ncbi:MAG TPA: DedA family protein [Pyrinomonadaceae bacterium]|jgi:membrane protein DedA with SNARE-associated domain|nr:DedA family protein [Pyrinomonadaceae bacterium]
MDGQFFYELVEKYGLFAVFFLAMIEGDITLLLAGVLAHSAFFGEYSFLKVLCAGTLGGVASDNIAYAIGRGTRTSVCEYRFYRVAQPRIERLTQKFGALSIFLSKFIYGLRWGSCAFYGMARMPYLRFLLLTFGSCFLWVFALSGAGYFFSGAIINFLGDFHHLGIGLLIIVVVGIIGFYLIERYWLSEKVEHVNPEAIHKLEQAAEDKLHEIGQEIKEHIPPLTRRSKDSAKRKPGDVDGD